MSLVSYGASSSEESEGEEETTPPQRPTPTPKPEPAQRPTSQKKSLFSSLPPPKGLTAKLPPPSKVASKPNTDNTPMETGADTKKKSSLFASLPPPKSGSSLRKGSPIAEKATSGATGHAGLGLNLPPPKKKAPVKISLPSLPDPDSDEEEEPVTKKPKQSKGVAGLFASLPKPRHAATKEANRILIPHTLTKKKPVVKPVVKLAAKPPPNKSKTVSSLVTGYDDDDDDDGDDEGSKSSSFFSLDKQDSVKPSVPGKLQSKASMPSVNFDGIKTVQDSRTSRKGLMSNSVKSDKTEPQKSLQSTVSVKTVSQEKQSDTVGRSEDESASNIEINQNDAPLTFTSPTQDAPLSFKSGASTVPVYRSMTSGDSDAPLSFSSGSQQQYGDSNQQRQQQQQAGSSGYGSAAAAGEQYADYSSYQYGAYNQPYTGENEEQWQETQLQQQQQQEDNYFQDKEFQKMMGKHNRSKEAIDIIDVNADEYLGPNPGTEWMLKSMTEEKEYRGNLKKEQLPSSQQKRKHQITFLAHQAKERELQLKNQWANNRMTRKQTQAKYGF